MPPIYLSVVEHPECADKASVYLDGDEQIYVVAAHEGEGWVERYWMDDRGHPMLTVPLQRKLGKVEIRPKPGVTREVLERIADTSERVTILYHGSDGVTHMSSGILTRHLAERLIADMRRYMPMVEAWIQDGIRARTGAA